LTIRNETEKYNSHFLPIISSITVISYSKEKERGKLFKVLYVYCLFLILFSMLAIKHLALNAS